ncbi:MAG TPA: hypothetical protein VFT59_02960 [Candidatus Saccharimonadales bacterium]|nr:hypothetical protein [Candidatus Saccharimonadales bacterium]
MTAQVTRRVWVTSVKKLFTYVPVTIGEPQDIGMSYDVTMQPLDNLPAQYDDNGVKLEIVDDLTALYEILAELGLYVSNLLTRGIDKLWNKLGLDKAARDRSPSTRREYRVGHPKYRG